MPPTSSPRRKGRGLLCTGPARSEGVRSLILRAGDYFGPHVTGNSWLASSLNLAGRSSRSPIRQAKHRLFSLPGIAEQARHESGFGGKFGAQSLACEKGIDQSEAAGGPFWQGHQRGSVLLPGRLCCHKATIKMPWCYDYCGAIVTLFNYYMLNSLLLKTPPNSLRPFTIGPSRSCLPAWRAANLPLR